LLAEAVAHFGKQVVHIFDRGYAGGPWLEALFSYYSRVRFVMRWPKAYQLLAFDPQVGVSSLASLRNLLTKAAWQHTRGKRSWGHRQLWDSHHRCWRKVGVLAQEVRHPDHPDRPLWLVVARLGGGHEPWYLLSSEPAKTTEQAWRIVLSYARRWQTLVSWRYAKSELAFESPRLWWWENRLKLLLLATLAFSFLLSLAGAGEEGVGSGLVSWLLRNWWHRTGRHLQSVELPLYRLRGALSRLWQAHPPPLAWSARQSSG